MPALQACGITGRPADTANPPSTAPRLGHIPRSPTGPAAERGRGPGARLQAGKASAGVGQGAHAGKVMGGYWRLSHSGGVRFQIPQVRVCVSNWCAGAAAAWGRTCRARALGNCARLFPVSLCLSLFLSLCLPLFLIIFTITVNFS